MVLGAIWEFTNGSRLPLNDESKAERAQILTSDMLTSDSAIFMAPKLSLQNSLSLNSCTCTCSCDLASICVPSIMPTLSPSLSSAPSASITLLDTLPPTLDPTPSPTSLPSAQSIPPTTTSPTLFPTSGPQIPFTSDPTVQPTKLPSPFPTFQPTSSRNGTGAPTRFPRGGSIKPIVIFGDLPTLQPNNNGTLPYPAPIHLPYLPIIVPLPYNQSGSSF